MRNLLPRSLLGIFLWAQIALGAGALAGEAPERFASVYKISGVVRVGDAAGGAQRELKQGDVLRVGDVVQASATGRASLARPGPQGGARIPTRNGACGAPFTGFFLVL